MKKPLLFLLLLLVSQAAFSLPEAYPGLSSSAYHSIDLQQLKSTDNMLLLPLFGAKFNKPQQLNKSKNGDISFEQQNEHGHLNVTVGNNSIFGSWHRQGKDYRLTTDKSGSWLIELPTDHLITDSCGTAHSSHASSADVKSQTDKAAATTIDVLVVHNQPLAARYPGNLMQSRINHYVHVANQTFANSGLDLAVRLVGIEELPYNYNNSNNDMLFHMRSTLANITTITGLQNLKQMRQDTGADLIIAIRPHDIETRGNCGLAFYPDSDFDRSFGINMVSDGMSSWSNCSDQVFVHEIGHNLGAAHQYGEGGGTFQAQGSAFIKLHQFNTVMGSFGTAQNNRSKRLPMFSNPNLACGGYACGLSSGSEPSNNVAVINGVKNLVANYYPDTSNAAQPEVYQRSERDYDGDGVNDWADHFPFDASESTDADFDGVGDNSDAFPNDPSEQADNDQDGIGDNADNDDDNDGRIDSQDAFPFDPTEQDDDDWDGVGNNRDAFPNDSAEQFDYDQDGIGDHADTDADNDGVADLFDGVTGYQQDILIINEGNNRILRFDAQTGRSMGIEVLPDDGLLTFQSDFSYDFHNNHLYYTSSSGVKRKNMMQRVGSEMMIPPYIDNTNFKIALETGFPTALYKPNGMPLLVSKIDRGGLSAYDIQNPTDIRFENDWLIAPEELQESFIDVEQNGQLYLLGLEGRIYRGNNENNFTRIDQNISFREALDMTIHPDGSLLISDYQKKQVIQVNANTGQFMGIFANLATLSLGRPSGLVVTKNDTLLVATKDDNKIHQFDALSGEYLGVLVDGLGLDSPYKMLVIPSLQDRFHNDENKVFSPNAGMWFNPETNGRGFDIGVFGNRLQVIWFTYDDDGSPIWYYTAGEVNGMEYESPLYQTHKVGTEATTFEEVGHLSLTFKDERTAQIAWEIGQFEDQETLQWHFFNADPATEDYTGMWTRTDDPGWGVSVTTQGDTTVVLSFLYDDEGIPRWVNSSNGIGLSPLNFDVGTFFNDTLCPGCIDGNINDVVVSGNMTFDFSGTPYWSSEMVWPAPLSGTWMLDQSTIHRITSPPVRPR